jgi:TM2 domain-containing membrane protein YozV
MSRNGSAGNVIAAICSFFYAGLGQLVQGRIITAIIHFLLASLGWLFFLGWLVHLYSIYDAAVYNPEK